MGNRLTGEMGYTNRRAYALEDRVTNRRETTIREPRDERPLHCERAVRGVRHLGKWGQDEIFAELSQTRVLQN